MTETMIMKEHISELVNDAMKEAAQVNYEEKYIGCSVDICGCEISVDYDVRNDEAEVIIYHDAERSEHQSPLLEDYIAVHLPDDLGYQQEQAAEQAEKDYEDEMRYRQELEYQFWRL